MLLTDAFVLSYREFENYNRICTFLTQDFGIITLIAKGAEKPTSANRAGINFFTLSKIELFLKNKNKIGTLKKATISKMYSNIFHSPEKIYVGKKILFLFNSLNNYSYDYEKTFTLFNELLELLNNSKNNFKILAISYKNFLNLIGIHFCTNSCVISGSKTNIYSLDLKSGGFISKEHFNKNEHKEYSLKFLKNFKKFNEDNYLPSSFEENNDIIIELELYLKNILGLYL